MFPDGPERTNSASHAEFRLAREQIFIELPARRQRGTFLRPTSFQRGTLFLYLGESCKPWLD